MKIFKENKFKAKDIINVDKKTIKSIPLSKYLFYYKDGTLIKTKDKPAVYFVQNGELKLVPSIKIFKKNKFKVKDIIKVSPEIIKKYKKSKNPLI